MFESVSELKVGDNPVVVVVMLWLASVARSDDTAIDAKLGVPVIVVVPVALPIDVDSDPVELRSRGFPNICVDAADPPIVMLSVELDDPPIVIEPE